MRIVKIEAFPFSELSDTAKEVAREWYRQTFNSDGYLQTFEDAEQVGLKITGFDVGYRQSVEGKFVHCALACAQLIEANHGESCATHQTAKNFLAEHNAIASTAPENEDDFDDFADVDAGFLRRILCDYRAIFRDECDFMQSDARIDENMESLDLEFTEFGKKSYLIQ